jgi:hypothetical protein
LSQRNQSKLDSEPAINSKVSQQEIEGVSQMNNQTKPDVSQESQMNAQTQSQAFKPLMACPQCDNQYLEARNQQWVCEFCGFTSPIQTEPDDVSQIVSQLLRKAQVEARKARDFYADCVDKVLAKKITGIDLEFAIANQFYWMGFSSGLAMARPNLADSEELRDAIATAQSEVRNVARRIQEV